MTTTTTIAPAETRSPLVFPAAGAGIAFGLAIGMLVVAGNRQPSPAVKMLTALAFAAAVSLPAVVALLVRRRCPPLLAGCAASMFPRVLLSMTPVLFPMFVLGGMLLTGIARPCTRGHTGRRHALGIGVVLVMSLLSPATLLLFWEPVDFVIEGGYGSTSAPSLSTVTISLLASGATVALALWFARPGPPPTPPPGGTP